MAKCRPYIRVSDNSDFWRLCRDFYRRQSAARDVFTGVAFCGFGVASLALLAHSVGLVLIFGAVLIGGVTSALAPLARAVVARRALRRGNPAEAEVLYVAGASKSRVTLDALANGWAEGRRVVRSAGAAAEQQFATDAPWARDLKRGSRMRVLVDSRLNVLLELPPHAT